MKHNLIAYRNEGNLGNTIQTLGLMEIIKPDGFVYFDDIKNNSKEEVLICNGWFEESYQNININTKAIFAGIHIINAKKCKKWFKKQGRTIGARDPETVKHLSTLGIESTFIGCASLLFPEYRGERKGITYVDFDHDRDLTHWISPTPDWEWRMRYARRALEIYKTSELVCTTRLHVLLPCLAMGTPVYISDQFNDTRFSLLESLGVEFNKINIPNRDLIDKARHIFQGFLFQQMEEFGK